MILCYVDVYLFLWVWGQHYSVYLGGWAGKSPEEDVAQICTRLKLWLLNFCTIWSNVDYIEYSIIHIDGFLTSVWLGARSSLKYVELFHGRTVTANHWLSSSRISWVVLVQTTLGMGGSIDHRCRWQAFCEEKHHSMAWRHIVLQCYWDNSHGC